MQKYSYLYKLLKNALRFLIYKCKLFMNYSLIKNGLVKRELHNLRFINYSVNKDIKII